MSGIKYSGMTVTPYEYWDLRLRHFELMQQSASFTTDEEYNEAKELLFTELGDFVKGQEEDGLKTTSE